MSNHESKHQRLKTDYRRCPWEEEFRCTIRLEYILHANTAFRTDHQRIGGGGMAQYIFDLLFHENRAGRRGRSILLMTGKNGEGLCESGQEGVGNGLRLHALARVNKPAGRLRRQTARARKPHTKNPRGPAYQSGFRPISVSVLRRVMQPDAFWP